jgi:hypothetical protein
MKIRTQKEIDKEDFLELMKVTALCIGIPFFFFIVNVVAQYYKL